MREASSRRPRSRTVTRRGRSLDDCGRKRTSREMLHILRAQRHVPACTVRVHEGCMGKGVGRREVLSTALDGANALENNDNMPLAGHGICEFAVDREVLVSPEHLRSG